MMQTLCLDVLERLGAYNGDRQNESDLLGRLDTLDDLFLYVIVWSALTLVLFLHGGVIDTTNVKQVESLLE